MAYVLVGVRVVRGPDWNRFNQDGGEGGVGSVVETCAGEAREAASASCDGATTPDTACVAWDSGHTGTYRCGAGGKHDLRVFDTAAIGVKHMGSKCMECSGEDLAGILWQCKECANQQLCNPCYHNGSHDLTHRFFCSPFNDAGRVLAPERNGQMMSVACGAFYYPNHLPVLSCRRGQGTRKAEHGGLAVGSLVQVPRLDTDILVAMLHGRPDCLSRDIAQVIYEVGEVDYFEMETNDVFVRYAHLGKTLGLNPGVLEKVTRFADGDRVRLIDDVMAIMAVDKFFRAWDDETQQLLGKIGVVTAITAQNHVTVQYASTTTTVHPACLVRAEVQASNPASSPRIEYGAASSREVADVDWQSDNGRMDAAAVSPGDELSTARDSLRSRSSSSDGDSRYVTPDVSGGEAQDVVAVPNVPSVPGDPAVPNVPSVPGDPAVPNVPSAPGDPAVPNVPSVPGDPAVPSVPSVPGFPHDPGQVANQAPPETAQTVADSNAGDDEHSGGTLDAPAYSGLEAAVPSPPLKRRQQPWGKLACNFSNAPAGLPASAPAEAVTAETTEAAAPTQPSHQAAASVPLPPEATSAAKGEPSPAPEAAAAAEHLPTPAATTAASNLTPPAEVAASATHPAPEAMPVQPTRTTTDTITLSSADSTPACAGAVRLNNTDADRQHAHMPLHPRNTSDRPLLHEQADLFRDEKRGPGRDRNGFTYTNPADGVQFNIPLVANGGAVSMEDGSSHAVPRHREYNVLLEDSSPQQGVPTAEVDIGDIVDRMFSTSASDGAVPMDTEDPVMVLAELVATGTAADLRKHLEESNSCVNEPIDEYSVHCVHIAACLGRDFSIQLLHEYGADVEAQLDDGRTAAHLAAMRNHVGVISVLHRLGTDLEALDTLKVTPLHLAARAGSLLVTRELTRLLADVNCQDDAGDTPLHKAVYHGHSQLANYLLDVGADVALYNCHHHSALQFAASHGTEQMMEAFLEHAPELVNGLVSDNYPPLHCAAIHGNYSVADLLVRQPAVDINAKARRQETPLNLAVTRGHKACVELLVQSGASLDSENERGNTPLHTACILALSSLPGGADSFTVAVAGEGSTSSMLSDGPSQAIDAIEMMLSYETPRQNKMAAIACFLARRGANLDYYNHEFSTPLELCSDPEMAEVIRSFSPKEQPAHPTPICEEDVYFVSDDPSMVQSSGAFHASGYASYFGMPMSGGLPAAAGWSPGMTTGRGTTSDAHSTAGGSSRACARDVDASQSAVASQPGGVVAGTVGGTRDRPARVGSAACTDDGSRRDGDDDDEEDCILCDELATARFLPCGHVQTCAACSVFVKKCAACRALVRRRVARNGGEEYVKSEDDGVLIIPL